MRSETKITLTLTPEAYKALGEMATYRKRGEFVSQLVMDAAAGKAPSAQVQPGILERIEVKLDKVLSRQGSTNG